MTTQTKKSQNGFRLFILFFLVVILMTLLTVATYTWFTISRTPRVSDMNMYINSVTGLEISTDPQAEKWQLQLDFRDMVDETAPLRPVTWSDARQQFYAANYGLDGRLLDYNEWQPLTDERNANKNNTDCYYIKATFFAKTGQTVDVSLSPAVEVDDGIDGHGTYLIGTPLWDGQHLLHDNGGQGAENAVRIGIRITPVAPDGQPLEDQQSEFFIYEPNCDLHADGTVGYVPTPSIDGTYTLIDEDRLIRQSASTWAEAYPVQRSVVVHELGEFLTPTKLFELKAGEMVKIDLYIWLEGQDVDCTNSITEAQILASIQLSTETQGQSGLVPIE